MPPHQLREIEQSAREQSQALGSIVSPCHTLEVFFWGSQLPLVSWYYIHLMLSNLHQLLQTEWGKKKAVALEQYKKL